MCVSHDVQNGTTNDAPHNRYRLDENWPHYPVNMQFQMGSGVAVDKDDIIIYLRDMPSEGIAPAPLKQFGDRAAQLRLWEINSLGQRVKLSIALQVLAPFFFLFSESRLDLPILWSMVAVAVSNNFADASWVIESSGGLVSCNCWK